MWSGTPTATAQATAKKPRPAADTLRPAGTPPGTHDQEAYEKDSRSEQRVKGGDRCKQDAA
jgi:hypothetical protein